MQFRKNIGRKERVFRVAAGALMILCGLAGLGMSPLGWFFAAAGLITVVTGLIRYCPACDIAGKQSCDI